MPGWSDPVAARRCERARAWGALAPDAELAELERRLLDAHLRRCGACRHFAAEVAAVTSELRATALRRPTRAVFQPAARRRELARRARAIGAVAAVALVAVGIAARQPLPTREPAQRPAVADRTQRDEAEIQAFRRLRRESVLGAAAYPDRPPYHFGTQPA
jgi:hypothetical protein